jgi:ER-bound oxygenase mpaB/B'/Rubber oxygenase, catalytic domain
MIAITNKFLDSQRLVGDVEADTLIETTFAANQQSILYGLFKLEEKAVESQPDSELKKFFITQKPKPTWFNQKRLQKGQQLFKQYALEMMALLGAMSLPYCYAASPGNKALYLSDKMRNSPGKRLMDTASFVISVLTPGTLEEGEFGHIHINKVRLIHAMSRYYLKKLPIWDMEWGVPINQEDMAGTNMAFSYVILLGMQQSGFILSQKEKEDFLFAWRYIGYQMNIDEALLPSTFLEARELATTIKIRNFKKTEEGIILTKELLSYYKVSVPPDQANLVPSQIRFYLGNEVAEYIGITSDPIKDMLAATVSTFKSLQSLLSVQPDSYQKMISQHSLLKKKFVG